MNKLYKYCPYCGEQLVNNITERKTQTSFDDLDPKIFDEKKIVLIDLKSESMRLPFSLENGDNLELLDKKRKELIDEFKKLKKFYD